VPYDADVIVVGSGAGGATLAYACARAGKSVLLLERGNPYAASPLALAGDTGVRGAAHDEQAMLIEKKPYDDRKIDVNGFARQLYMGGVLGGGTALYGAALMRPSPQDFHPGKSYADRLPRAQWDWPIGYDDLEPHYTEAEQLFGVSGANDDDFGPIPKPCTGFPNRPLPLHPVNQRLMGANQRHGLRPFRLPLAIDPARCLQCNVCPGYICPTGARRSSGHLLNEAASAGWPVRVVSGMEVEQISWTGDGSAEGISALERLTGRRLRFRARRYVLGAGAIGSPLILLRSGVNHPLVGRNYMMHLSPIVVGIFRQRIGADEGFLKQVGFADYYFGAKDYAHKLGLVQSLPVPGLLMLAKSASRWLPRFVLQFLRKRMLPLVGIVEDLPNSKNRVSWGTNGRPCLNHRFAAYDRERGHFLARFISTILTQAGALVCISSAFASEEHVAHQCGTLRFGVTPAHGVLDPECRLFGHPNVFVVDGSFMPTSLGVGPALTIIANALRIANVVAHEV
jgi:choline dehydrogenase-like flavoprotein